MGDLNPHLIHGPLGPPKSSTQTASRSVQPFLQGSLVWQTDRQTDRPADRPRYTRSLTIDRIYVRSTAMRSNNRNIMQLKPLCCYSWRNMMWRRFQVLTSKKLHRSAVNCPVHQQQVRTTNLITLLSVAQTILAYVPSMLTFVYLTYLLDSADSTGTPNSPPRERIFTGCMPFLSSN